MIVPSVVKEKFVEWEPSTREVAKRVEDILIPYTRRKSYLFEGRRKTLESLAEKLESGRYKEWGQIDDLYACTIAVPLPDNELEVRQYLVDRFELIDSRERGGTAKEPGMFRFDSTRLIFRLHPSVRPEVVEGANIFSVKFEIQIKTIYDFAWSKTTHALTYKSDFVDWKRYRLAAHLKAASEQIEFLLRGFDDAAQHLVESPWASIKDKAKIAEFFQDCVARGAIPNEVVPKDWSRFSENFYRAMQALMGRRPTGENRDSLDMVTRALEELEEHFSTLNSRTFPRSVSLYQYCIGYLSSTLDGVKSHNNLNFLRDANLFEILPDAAAKLPGPLFSLD